MAKNQTKAAGKAQTKALKDLSPTARQEKGIKGGKAAPLPKKEATGQSAGETTASQ